MQILKTTTVFCLGALVVFSSCQRNDLEDQATYVEATTTLSQTSVNEFQKTANAFWKANPDPSEDALEAYYSSAEIAVGNTPSQVSENVDLSLLYSPNAQSGKFVFEAIASNVISWGMGKALDKVFSNNTNGGTSTNNTASLTTAINNLDSRLQNEHNRILRTLGQIPARTKLLDGKSNRDGGIAAMRKGDYKVARNKLANALSDLRAANPYGYTQYLPTLALLSECNRRLAKSENAFFNNMHRVTVEADLCFKSFDINFIDKKYFANSDVTKDQIITAVLFRSNLFKKKNGNVRKLPKGNVDLYGVRELRGFLIGPKHTEWTKGKKGFNIKVRNYTAVALQKGNLTLKTPKSVGFGGDYQYMWFRKGLNNGDYKFRLVPYGTGDKFFLSTNTPRATDQRHFARFNDNRGTDLYGLRLLSYGRVDRRSAPENLLLITIKKR